MTKKPDSYRGFFHPRVLLGFVLCGVGVFLGLVGFGISSGGSAFARNAKQNQETGTPAQAGSRISASAPEPESFDQDKVAPQVMADTANGINASVVILLAEQADVSAAYEMKDHDARGWFVYHTLTQHAARTQAGLQNFLTTRGIAYQSFWAANMIVATVDRSLVAPLAARADVQRIDSNKPTRWIEDPEVANFGVTTPDSPNTPNTAEWGVLNVNAPAVWALGFNGTGMVIGNQDTGMRWTHNALKPKYRGWNGVVADHNFNWHDSIHSGGGTCGANTVAPCDDHGHGTHTTGTTIGDDGTGNQVGVAPGAKWIGCRNMNQGNGTPATYTECFQFFIAPTDLAGNNANPALRPHVMNNSWGCPPSEGCSSGTLETIVNNTQAAGIFVAVSAGNSGSGCSTVSDAPAIYSASFSVGAIASNNTLASFSSRGPSTFYTPNLRKPNVSAPGSVVRSSTRTSDSTFADFSGTSMAGPHVAGVVALLWSARPQLVRDIAATKTILENTANPGVILTPVQTCGGIASTQIPNNSFGYGRVDALAAVNAAGPTPTPIPTASPTPAPTPIISLTGTVSYCSSPSLGPVPNVMMTLTGTSGDVQLSDSSGNYTFAGLASGGSYTVTPTKTALAPGSAGIDGVDALAIQRHFLGIALIPAGCRRDAADVDGDTFVNGVDATALQRFFLGLVTGIANTGQYQFTPANRTYSPLMSSQTGQNYDTLILGDIASSFVHRPAAGPSRDVADKTNEVASTVAEVALPDVEVDRSHTNFVAAVTSSAIDGRNHLVGFQGDFTFDERVVTFESEPVRKGGLTAGNWNVSGNILPGPGPMRTLRVLAYSLDFVPLSGTGTLFELRIRLAGKAAEGTPLSWAVPPHDFLFIDTHLDTQSPGVAVPGNITPWVKGR